MIGRSTVRPPVCIIHGRPYGTDTKADFVEFTLDHHGNCLAGYVTDRGWAAVCSVRFPAGETVPAAIRFWIRNEYATAYAPIDPPITDEEKDALARYATEVLKRTNRGGRPSAVRAD